MWLYDSMKRLRPLGDPRLCAWTSGGSTPKVALNKCPATASTTTANYLWTEA